MANPVSMFLLIYLSSLTLFHSSQLYVSAEEVKIPLSGSAVTSNTPPKTRPKEAFPILDTLFPNFSLDEAWETHPLLTTSDTSQPHYNCTSSSCENDINTIPTLHLNPTQVSARTSIFQNLFSQDDLDEIFSHPLEHGSDYRIAKKVFINGEEWTGILPGELTLEQAVHAVFLMGHSLILNSLHLRWRPVAKLARIFETETSCGYVSCNLYLTPEVDDGERSGMVGVNWRSGFEAHFDWMDVIILQISGEKMWSVAKSPMMYLPTKDLKRKPNLDEMDEYVDNRYTEFLLKPGDALFIPRGFIHNASTVALDGDVLNNGVSRNPSIHLTFGIEHNCQTILEALLHHALRVFSDSEEGRKNSCLINRVAVKKEACDDAAQNITWLTLLHFAISEVTRRFDCKTPPEDEWEQNACHLRRSILLHPTWRHIAAAANTCDQDDCLLTQYLTSLKTVKRLSKLSEAISLISNLYDSEDLRVTFCHPYATDLDLIQCDKTLNSLSEDAFEKAMNEFYEFAVKNYDEALEQMKKRMGEKRNQNFESVDEKLRMVGQSAV